MKRETLERDLDSTQLQTFKYDWDIRPVTLYFLYNYCKSQAPPGDYSEQEFNFERQVNYIPKLRRFE